MGRSRKIAIVGTGYVGASICYALMLKETAQEIVLIDRDVEKAKGEILDIMHGIPYMGTAKIYQGEYSDCRECDMIIVTAGKGRKTGQKRSDLLEENTLILKQIADEIKVYYNDGVILIVSNPVDAMTQKFTQWMNLPDGKVFGTGCILDASRLTGLIASYVGVSIDNIQATVIGEHGEAQYPLWNRIMVANIPIGEYCDMLGIPWDDKIKQELKFQVRDMGAEIIKRKERTHYGIATCVAYLADAVMYNRKIVASVSSVMQGECGIKGVAVSVPSLIGQNGVEKRLIDDLQPDEVAYLRQCCI